MGRRQLELLAEIARQANENADLWRSREEAVDAVRMWADKAAELEKALVRSQAAQVDVVIQELERVKADDGWCQDCRLESVDRRLAELRGQAAGQTRTKGAAPRPNQPGKAAPTSA